MNVSAAGWFGRIRARDSVAHAIKKPTTCGLQWEEISSYDEEEERHNMKPIIRNQMLNWGVRIVNKCGLAASARGTIV